MCSKQKVPYSHMRRSVDNVVLLFFFVPLILNFFGDTKNSQNRDTLGPEIIILDPDPWFSTIIPDPDSLNGTPDLCSSPYPLLLMLDSNPVLTNIHFQYFYLCSNLYHKCRISVILTLWVLIKWGDQMIVTYSMVILASSHDEPHNFDQKTRFEWNWPSGYIA